MAINVGVIGAGPWGKNHIRIYQEIENVRLKAVADINENMLKELKQAYKFEKTIDYKKIISDSSINAVNICTPASTHFKIAKEALLAEKNVLVEKPLATASKEAEELAEIAKEKKLVLAVGQVFRFDQNILEIKRCLKKGVFGKVRAVSLARKGLENPREDVGVIMDYAVHDLDIMCDVLGEDYPLEITATKAHQLKRKHEDSAIISTRFGSGTLGYCQVNWLIPKKMREFWLIGGKKIAHIGPINPELEIFESGILPKYGDSETFETFKPITKKGLSYKPKIDKKEPLKEELKHFIDCVENKKKPIIDGEVGLRTIKMAEAALLSAKEKRSVKLDENGDELVELQERVSM